MLGSVRLPGMLLEAVKATQSPHPSTQGKQVPVPGRSPFSSRTVWPHSEAQGLAYHIAHADSLVVLSQQPCKVLVPVLINLLSEILAR